MPKVEVSDIIGDFHFSIPIQVRFSDIDGYQHVNNGIYFNYYEHSRAAYLMDSCGWNVMEVGTVVAHVGIDFFRPIHMRDKLRAYVKCVKIGTTSFELEQYLIGETSDKKEVVFSKSNCTLVSVDMKTMKPVPIPSIYKSKLEG